CRTGYRVNPRITEDGGINEEDVGHHKEGGDAGAYLGADRCASFRELEERVEDGSARPYAGVSVGHRLLRLATPHQTTRRYTLDDRDRRSQACGYPTRGFSAP